MIRDMRGMRATILIDSGLPEAFWAQALKMAAYLRNRCPVNPKKLKKDEEKEIPSVGLSNTDLGFTITEILYETYYSKKPNYDHIQLFDSVAYVTVLLEKRKKVLS